MLQRLIPAGVVAHHIRSLVIRTGPGKPTRRDWPVIAVLFLTPAVATIWAWKSCLQLNAPTALLPAVSLMFAGLLAAFAQIASVRSKYRLPDGDYDPDWSTREMLDEAVAHVLTAALLSVAATVVILIGLNTGHSDGTTLARWASVTVTGIGTYLVLLFLMVIRKLWGAYEVANERDQASEPLHR